MNRLGYFAASILALWATLGWAADPPSADDSTEEMVITAKKREALQAFVSALAEAGPTDQLARWRDWICPSVVGIESAQAAWMEDRIAEIASLVQLRREKTPCQPKLIVAITADASGLARELEKARPITLRADGQWRLTRFVESDEPVRWLSITDQCGYGCALPGSRLVKDTTATLSYLLVLVDAAKVTDFTLAELADYVALAVLANPAPDTDAAAESILSMFDRPRTPGVQYALTDFDRAFLTGLYGSGVNLSAKQQRNMIIHSMSKGRLSDSSTETEH